MKAHDRTSQTHAKTIKTFESALRAGKETNTPKFVSGTDPKQNVAQFKPPRPTVF